MMIPSPNPAHAQTSSGSTLTGFTVTEQIQPVYDVYGGNGNPVTVSIHGSPLLISGTFTVTTLFKSTLTEINATSQTVTSGAEYITTINVNSNDSSFSISMQGSESGASFLWRYLAAIPFVTATGFALNPTLFVTVPSGTVLSQVYGSKGGSLPLSYASVVPSVGASQVTYSIQQPAEGGLLIFQSASFLPASI